ncbi:MAG TPA: hypothetical protein DF383_00170, partial [Deltaproteobacteria bacterium]|nr:hypothetical protein [Deltaproteobacteria bacterium]
AWALGQEAKCGCNLPGRKCIHGCDLKKHGHSHHDGFHAVQGSSSDTDKDQWISPSCAKQKQRQVLSFQSDPFLPQFPRFVLRPDYFVLDISPRFSFQNIISLPESPPPKGA